MKKTFSILLVIAMIACMLPVFAVSAAESVLVPVAKTAKGEDVYGQPTEPWAKVWTVSEDVLALNGGCDQGYFVFDNEVAAGKLTTTIKTNQASNSCNGIIFCLTDVDNDRAFWEGEDMVCYWLFVDEGNRVRVSEVGRYNGNPGWRDIIPGEKQVDLDDLGIDVTAGVELAAEWDGQGLINVYVNGTLTNTIDDTESPLTGKLCGVRMKETPVSGCTFSSFVIDTYQTTNPSGYYGNSANTGCGFLDGNMYPSAGLNAANSSELTVKVNGKPAYFNNGYLGEKHCAVREADYGDQGKVPGGWIQIGVVGADVVPGINTLLVTDKDGSTVILNFKASINALGTSYAKVVGDAKAKTVTAEIIFNTDPGFEIGTTFEGKCHDDHGNTATFSVTAYDSETKMYTIKAENYVPNQSLLELKVTSEGAYNGYFVSATINAVNNKTTFIGDSAIVDASNKVALSNPSVKVDSNGNSFSDANRLFDAQGNGVGGQKIEGNWPGAMTITFEAADGAKPSYIVFYTDDDGSWSNRAPKTVTISASKDNTNWTVLKENVATGIQNYNEKAFALELMADTEYKYFKVQITEKLGDQGGYFQLEEIVLLEGDKVEASREKVENLAGIVAYNGVAPACKHANTKVEGAKEATKDAEGYTGDTVCSDCGEVLEKGKTTPKLPATEPVTPPETVEPAPTGDSVVALVVLAVVSLLGMAFVSKKRG